MFTIIYNANPKVPKNINHLGGLGALTIQDSKNFEKVTQAIDFWFECCSPITRLVEFKDELAKKYKHLSEAELEECISIVEAREEDLPTEENIINQKALYNLKS